MKENATHIAVILDRTGSMESIRDDIIGGFNTFLKEQQEQPGSATVSLVQFDSQNPYEVIHRFKPIQQIPGLDRRTYVPRASTPLLDAIGRGINDLESSLSGIPESDRPEKIIMAIVTDGQENASHEFTRDQIVKMIKDKTDNANWQFVYLSADLQAIQDAHGYGVQMDAAMYFKKSGKGSEAVFNALSMRMSDYRASRKSKMEFEEEDRKRSNEDDPGNT